MRQRFILHVQYTQNLALGNRGEVSTDSFFYPSIQVRPRLPADSWGVTGTQATALSPDSWHTAPSQETAASSQATEPLGRHHWWAQARHFNKGLDYYQRATWPEHVGEATCQQYSAALSKEHAQVTCSTRNKNSLPSPAVFVLSTPSPTNFFPSVSSPLIVFLFAWNSSHPNAIAIGKRSHCQSNQRRELGLDPDLNCTQLHLARRLLCSWLLSILLWKECKQTTPRFCLSSLLVLSLSLFVPSPHKVWLMCNVPLNF